ncbi:MAG: hypothetical protein U1A78_10645 [Polyangia bacterium]
MIALLADASNGLPTAAHVIYIPGMLLLGVVLGYIIGSRAARDAFQAEQRRKEARAARRARAGQPPTDGSHEPPEAEPPGDSAA